MASISFFTPVEYNQFTSCGQLLTEAVDGYFYLGGRKAVTLPGHLRNGSQEVALQQGTTTWWKTALKVLSYATVVVPLIMLIAKAVLRSHYRFHNCGQDPVVPYYGPEIRVAAPLTLVRSTSPTDLKISVLYNQQFLPHDPIVPKPSTIETGGKYTWNVQTQADGTLNVDGRRVKMIWWEAMRQGAVTGVDAAQAVCVPRSEIKGFLEKVLKKMGVDDNELMAFVNYWKAMMDDGTTPYVLVQLIHPAELHKYVPEMQLEGEQAGRFVLSRNYFRFEAVPDASRGMEPAAYLSDLMDVELGLDAVIDLGGEVIGGVSKDWEPAFNEQFTGRYIYA